MGNCYYFWWFIRVGWLDIFSKDSICFFNKIEKLIWNWIGYFFFVDELL